MYAMLQTLDDHKPTYQDRLATPGDTHRLVPIHVEIFNNMFLN